MLKHTLLLSIAEPHPSLHPYGRITVLTPTALISWHTQIVAKHPGSSLADPNQLG